MQISLDAISIFASVGMAFGTICQSGRADIFFVMLTYNVGFGVFMAAVAGVCGVRCRVADLALNDAAFTVVERESVVLQLGWAPGGCGVAVFTGGAE